MTHSQCRREGGREIGATENESLGERAKDTKITPKENASTHTQPACMYPRSNLGR